LHGWRDDEEVIAALRTLITDNLEGLAEDIPDHVRPLPEGVGAAIAFGMDDKGEAHPLIFVRADLPSGLRADLSGFCTAFAAGAEHSDAEPDPDGIYYIGMERSPVAGPGAGLLGALMVQRIGRRPWGLRIPLAHSARRVGDDNSTGSMMPAPWAVDPSSAARGHARGQAEILRVWQ
jgi:hypothetical protein